MYEIKSVIERMKKTAQISSNIELAKVLNVSYNTLNTWIKREKLPQEIIFQFCSKYNISCDELLFNKKQSANQNNSPTFTYYGFHKELNIHFKAKLLLSKDSLFNNTFYLLEKEKIFFIAKVIFNPFYKKCQIEFEKNCYEITLDEFRNINHGLIIQVIN